MGLAARLRIGKLQCSACGQLCRVSPPLLWIASIVNQAIFVFAIYYFFVHGSAVVFVVWIALTLFQVLVAPFIVPLVKR